MDALRAELRSFLKLRPPYRPTHIRAVDRTQDDGFARTRLRYTTEDRDIVEAFLFEPVDVKSRGAILVLHQHNSQWEIGKSEIAGLAGDPLQAFGPALARRGVTVLAPDAIGFESRMTSAGWGMELAPPLNRPHSTAEGWLQYYNEMAYRIVRGEFLMTKVLQDCFSALEVLRAHTGMSPGVVGHSFGGIVTLFLAAVDETVPFACSSGALCSYRQKMASGTALEMSLIIPGFQTKYDLDDVLRCVAPRRMMIVSADRDPQSADAPRVVEQARPEFVKQGAGFDLLHVQVSGEHALDQYRFDTIVNWMAKQAAGLTSPET